MIRPIFTEIALFLTPFVLYAVFLWATRAGVLDLKSLADDRVWRRWRLPRCCWCSAAFFISRISPARRPAPNYVPAHIENGKFVPGTTK